MNLYQFAANNSINSVDPFGLWPCWLQNLWNSFFAPGTGYDPSEAPNYLFDDPYNQPDNPFYIPNEPVNPLYLPYFQFDANGNLVDPDEGNLLLADDALVEALGQINQSIDQAGEGLGLTPAETQLLLMALPVLDDLEVERIMASGVVAGDATATQLELNFGESLPWQNDQSGLVIGRNYDLSAPGELGPGEYGLSWLDVRDSLGQPANIAVNMDRLQNVMDVGLPIRDASDVSDLESPYLNAERSLLDEKGWNYQEGWWTPPAK
jgi:hypothetical protein